MKTTLLTALLLTPLWLPTTAAADVLLIDAIAESAPNSMAGLPRPAHSMSMDTVKQRFGEPLQTFPQIGEPPITRWDYEGYSVFFEYDLVITSVVHR